MNRWLIWLSGFLMLSGCATSSYEHLGFQIDSRDANVLTEDAPWLRSLKTQLIDVLVTSSKVKGRSVSLKTTSFPPLSDSARQLQASTIFALGDYLAAKNIPIRQIQLPEKIVPFLRHTDPEYADCYPPAHSDIVIQVGVHPSKSDDHELVITGFENNTQKHLPDIHFRYRVPNLQIEKTQHAYPTIDEEPSEDKAIPRGQVSRKMATVIACHLVGLDYLPFSIFLTPFDHAQELKTELEQWLMQVKGLHITTDQKEADMVVRLNEHQNSDPVTQKLFLTMEPASFHPRQVRAQIQKSQSFIVSAKGQSSGSSASPLFDHEPHLSSGQIHFQQADLLRFIHTQSGENRSEWEVFASAGVLNIAVDTLSPTTKVKVSSPEPMIGSLALVTVDQYDQVNVFAVPGSQRFSPHQAITMTTNIPAAFLNGQFLAALVTQYPLPKGLNTTPISLGENLLNVIKQYRILSIGGHTIM